MSLLVSKILNKFMYIFMVKCGPVARAIKSPSFPKNTDGKVLVHVGCGELNDPRYINIDARSMPHVHYVTESLEMGQFSPESVDLIYACHILEHVSHRKLILTLKQWFGRLKKGGVIRLSVPNFDTIINIYQDQGGSIDAIKLPLMGGQEYAFNYHYSVFNHNYLNELLQSSGFTVIRKWDPKSAPYYNFNDWAGSHFSVGGKEYQISLNLEAVK